MNWDDSLLFEFQIEHIFIYWAKVGKLCSLTCEIHETSGHADLESIHVGCTNN